MTNSDLNRSQVDSDRNDILIIRRSKVQLTGVYLAFHSRVVRCCLLSLACPLSIAIARHVISSCGVITLESVHTQQWQPDPLAGDVGGALLKYIRFLYKARPMGMESVADDLLIHLLAAMGFNQGNLLISSHTIRHNHSMRV